MSGWEIVVLAMAGSFLGWAIAALLVVWLLLLLKDRDPR